jgi:hypothetical protein
MDTEVFDLISLWFVAIVEFDRRACRRVVREFGHLLRLRLCSQVGFEPTIPAGERPQTHALDRAATGTG